MCVAWMKRYCAKYYLPCLFLPSSFYKHKTVGLEFGALGFGFGYVATLHKCSFHRNGNCAKLKLRRNRTVSHLVSQNNYDHLNFLFSQLDKHFISLFFWMRRISLTIVGLFSFHAQSVSTVGLTLGAFGCHSQAGHIPVSRLCVPNRCQHYTKLVFSNDMMRCRYFREVIDRWEMELYSFALLSLITDKPTINEIN